MFLEAVDFNQPLDSFDVSQVTNMHGMFSGATAFNQDISNWDVGMVTNMRFMFENCVNFDQDLGQWNVSLLEEANEMFIGAQLSPHHYDSILVNWGELSLQSSVTFSGGNSEYCAQAVKDSIVDNFMWNITDGGIYAYCDKDTTTFDAGSWDFGIPYSNRVAIIKGDYDTSADGGNFDAKELIVQFLGSLFIDSGYRIRVKQELLIEGEFGVKKGGEFETHYVP